MREIITSLEMTAPSQLVPGRPAPAEIVLEDAGPSAVELVRAMYARIWEPLAAVGRTTWSDEQWAVELSRAGVHSVIARVDAEAAGFAELELEPGGDVGIVVFGLVPEFIGRGYGAEFLTAVTERAWRLGTPTRRVWLQTSSLDHPHALENYKRRGFRVFASSGVP
jgi:GNAT superfamily N-acetyltransferase